MHEFFFNLRFAVAMLEDADIGEISWRCRWLAYEEPITPEMMDLTDFSITGE